MATLTIVNPVAQSKSEVSTAERVPVSPRLASLAGKTIGLAWNAKAMGDVALARTQENLQRLYPDTKFKMFFGEHGTNVRHASEAQFQEMARDCDAVIGTSGD